MKSLIKLCAIALICTFIPSLYNEPPLFGQLVIQPKHIDTLFKVDSISMKLAYADSLSKVCDHTEKKLDLAMEEAKEWTKKNNKYEKQAIEVWYSQDSVVTTQYLVEK